MSSACLIDGATVEIINMIRSIVAIGRYLTFLALALKTERFDHNRLRNDRQPKGFAQKVRRFYPFFPVIGGKVLESFDWNGHHFYESQWVILDIYGSNHHCRHLRRTRPV